MSIEPIDTTEAAKVLGISRLRVLQMINEPCPDCGERRYVTEKNGDKVIIDYLSPHGCERCHFTGRRLPYVKRLGRGSRAPYLINPNDLILVAKRFPGYPPGRKRRKKTTA